MMQSSVPSEPPLHTHLIQFHQSGIFIDGTPTLVLCSSLFYFRIPRGFWRERLQAVRAAGYNCIDVYMPWNYHEFTEGQWDFTGEHDLAAFLQLAADAGLWVLARPGPYICSEWDGGGLPAYLLTQPGLRLRQYEPMYLAAVSRWFDRILPILQRFQQGVAGSIIAIQLENELDFYGCDDPSAYIAALRDLAIQHAITVPLVVCAGQGDLVHAGGDVPGVVPTCNFYPNDRDPSIEELVAPYEARLRARGLPLCTTETNRNHQTLRRLLSCGAKWLGPYLQVSGSNTNFTNAINNWGTPLAFLSSDYDFGGMIGGQGQQRAEMIEARLLSRLINALGPALAQAHPVTDHGITLFGTLPAVEGGTRALALHGGGLLLALPNLSNIPQQFQLYYGQLRIPLVGTCVVSAGQCPFIVLDLPLHHWGIAGKLVYSTAELCFAHANTQHTHLVFQTSGVAELSLQLDTPSSIHVDGLLLSQVAEQITLHSTDSRGQASFRFTDGPVLHIVLIEREQAARLLGFTADGSLHFMEEMTTPARSVPQLVWQQAAIAHDGHELATTVHILGDTPKQLEYAGLLRGFGWYHTEFALPSTAQPYGLLLHDASDIVSVYQGATYLGTAVPGGGTNFLPLHTDQKLRDIRVRAEIWGHSNFDDIRLPALRLHALRGLRDITAVLHKRALQTNWRWYAHASDANDLLASQRYTALVNWGNWISYDQPEHGIYLKQVALAEDADTWVLHFAGLQALVRVIIDGQDCGIANPFDPFVDISHAVTPGGSATIALYVERWQRQSTGELTLFEGRRAVAWAVAGAAERELWAAAQRATPANALDLPYQLGAGQLSWLLADASSLTGQSWALSCDGHNLKITVLLNGREVGRLWLPSANRPSFVGGNANLAYLPAPWLNGQNDRLALLIESIGQARNGELSALVLRAV